MPVGLIPVLSSFTVSIRGAAQQGVWVPSSRWAPLSLLARLSLLSSPLPTCLGLSFWEVVGVANSAPSPLPLLSNTFSSPRPSYLVTLGGGGLDSIESAIPSMGWQEREVAEFMGVTFRGKSDSRTLFLWSMVGGSPLKKAFPNFGFWSVSARETGLVWERSYLK